MKITADFRERRSGIVELLEQHYDIEVASLVVGITGSAMREHS